MAATGTPAASRQLGDELMRSAWLFQAGCALPTLLVLGFLAFVELLTPFISLYDFITDTVNSLMAAGIIFIVLVQRKNPTLNKPVLIAFEVGKSGLATAMWLWLLLDSLFGPRGRTHYRPHERSPRVVRAAISSILLWILFYPTLAYSIYAWRQKKVSAEDRERAEEGAAEEDTPLLADGS